MVIFDQAFTKRGNIKLLLLSLLLLFTITISVALFSYKSNLNFFSDAQTNGTLTPNNTLSLDYTSPYGIDTYGGDLSPNSEPLITFQKLGIYWWRYQLGWNRIETSPGIYDWSTLDAAVALANSNKVHIDFPIQEAPPWHQTQICDGKAILPGPNDMAIFASALATRYNGRNGHGYIDNYEIGNEEFDNYWNIDFAHSEPCRAPSLYGPVLKAGYQAIKVASPQAVIGMFGLWWEYTPHIKSYIQWLYQNGYGSYFDYANYHYYICAGNPAITSGSQPSFDLEWQTIHQMMNQNGDGQKPIWVTETGWTVSGINQNSTCIVSPQTQANYLKYVMTEAKNSHVVGKVFWYTVTSNDDGMNIIPPSGPLPAYIAWQNFIQQYSQWTSSSTVTPTPTLTPTPFPTICKSRFMSCTSNSQCCSQICAPSSLGNRCL